MPYIELCSVAAHSATQSDCRKAYTSPDAIYEPIRFADSRPARVFPRVSFGTALTNVTSVISAYIYGRPRSVEKQSIVGVSPLVEDQVADVIDDVLKLRNHARHPTQLGIWQCARPIFPVLNRPGCARLQILMHTSFRWSLCLMSKWSKESKAAPNTTG